MSRLPACTLTLAALIVASLFATSPAQAGQPGNDPPTANFSSSCNNLACTFTDLSTDVDGKIVSRAWAFGDGGTSTATNPIYIYAAAGTFTVSLTVTDNAGAASSKSKSHKVLNGGFSHSTTSNGAGTWQFYNIQVPSGRRNLSVVLDGPACDGILLCSNDLDLYVRRGALPTASAYDCRPYTPSSDESCNFANPAADRWYIGVYVFSGSNVAYTISATY